MEGNAEVEQSKLEVARELVERELQDSGNINHYLNNFECWLPGGLNRSISEKLGHMDETPVERYGGEELTQLRRNQTDRQFYEAIDKALEAEGFSLDEVRSWQGNQNWRDDMNQMVLREKMLPVYIRLRSMGYSIVDLRS